MKYRYTYTKPDGKQYIAYSSYELAFLLGVNPYATQNWKYEDLPKRLREQGHTLEIEPINPRKYVLKKDGETYEGATLKEVADQVGVTYQALQQALDRGYRRPNKEIYCIDYIKNRIKYDGKPWQPFKGGEE